MTDAIDLKIDAALDRVLARFRPEVATWESSGRYGPRKPPHPDPKMEERRKRQRAYTSRPEIRARIIAAAKEWRRKQKEAKLAGSTN